MILFNSPIAKKRIARFKKQRLACYSFILLLTLYGLSLFSELLCNSVPLYVSYKDVSYFPVFKFYTEETFLDNGKKTRPDYKRINAMPVFQENDDNYMLFPPLRYGPLESIDPAILIIENTVDVAFSPVERVGRVNVRKDYTISRSASFGTFAGVPEKEVKGSRLTDFFVLSDTFKASIERRFQNLDGETYSERLKNGTVIASLSTYKKRKRPPKTVRIMMAEVFPEKTETSTLSFNNILETDIGRFPLWETLTQEDKSAVIRRVRERFVKPVDPFQFTLMNRLYKAEFVKEDIRYPYKPVRGHVLGIDGAGRDVLARIIYGFRISVTFGLLLVGFSMVLGICAGAVQGYFGGKTDITAQRIIEIWSSLPFLYIMILMGAVYGRSFGLLLFCYGIFNWIGISYYVRAEFLSLRKKAFVESAKCMGVPARKIIFRHIMPNAMTPVVTFFPFSLVGAIGSLAALDYLGFGLPPPTPSWGELFYQAQQYRWAWWLIVYPALALFVVMLAGVFIGDGIRNALDPKQYTRLD